MAEKKRSKLLEFALIFAIVYLLTQLAFRFFFPDQFGNGKEAEFPVHLTVQDKTVKEGHHPVLVLRNNTATDLALTDRCPMPPVDVFRVHEGAPVDERPEPLTTEQTALPCSPLTLVKAGEKVTISLAPWKYSLFGELGEYSVALPLPDAEKREGIVANFKIHKADIITQLFRTFISKPLLNGLILITSVMPGYNLGLAIILLTLLVKIILFFPTQHALEGQKKLQAVQPKLDELKEKYKGNPEMLQKETLRIWKEHKINPMQSCLPMLVQFPVLIGIYYVIRDGSVLELSTHLLYGPYQNLPWHFDPQFLGLNLTVPNMYILPPLLVVLQFLQMKLSFAISERKKRSKEKVIDVGTKPDTPKKSASAMQMQQTMMLYGLPLMIGFFALQFPAAVALYWGISTVFAIGQQIVVNRKDIV